MPYRLCRLSGQNGVRSIDGKQRLTAIKEFLDGEHADGRKFRLKGLRILSQLEGKTWQDLQDDDEWGSRLENEPLRTTVLRGWDNENVLYEIFYRLNSGSVRLSPMELRMSLYPGEFLKFIIAWTENIGPLHHLLRKRQPDARMADVELAIRFLAFREDDIEYRGDLKQFLDECCKSKNLQFSNNDHRDQTSTLLNEMNLAIDCGIDIFESGKFCRKFEEGKYETRFNRAIFDVLVGSLSRPEVRDWARQHPQDFVRLYEDVSTGSPEFVRSVVTTTKSVEATARRFSIWFHAVSDATGFALEIPSIKK